MPRKADVFAGDGSIAGKLRKRREAMDAGDPSGGAMPELQAKDDTKDNRPSNVLKRGYYLSGEDE